MTFNLKEKLAANPWLKWLGLVLGVFFVFGMIIAMSSVVFSYKYQDRIFPGIKVNDYNLGGLTQEQAEKIILGNVELIYQDGFTFTYKNETKEFSDSLALRYLTIANSSMAQKSYNFGREGNNWQNFYQRLKLLFFGYDLPLDYQFNRDELEAALRLNFAALENPAVNSKLETTVVNSKNKQYEINFSQDRDGTAFDYKKALDKLNVEIANYRNPVIEMKLVVDKAQITRDMAVSYSGAVAEQIAVWPIKLTSGEKTYEVEWEDYLHWLELSMIDGKLGLIFNKEMILGQLDAFGQGINIEAQNAKFNMKDGKVFEFQPSVKGLAIDLEASYEKIIEEIINQKNVSVELVIKETAPVITIDSVNDLGITELIGVGESTFAGSPANRHHNIRVGAATINGLLVAPGEEFSLSDSLGEVDGQHGYLPEMVIKGDKTIAEYGGGLCQVATTLFRVALAAGVQITERKPHTYRVSYYEPAGTDAAIYQPHPDVKFINDTGNYILIQTFVEGNYAKFEFWGTSDGRTVELSKPKVFNITYPGPTKMVETTDLAPGVQKCTERSHNGADAVFTRTIINAEGVEKVEEWKSHYVAWRAVCLVGIEKPQPPPPTN